jgi:hypothetical protein
MKVLYISRPKPDYIQDFIFTGLVKILGVSNVVEFPWNPRFHVNFRKHPKNIGYVKNTLIKSALTSLDRRNVDVVIVASCHPDTFQTYLEIIDTIPNHIPRVFLDGGDWYAVGGDLNRLGGNELLARVNEKRPFDLIFKREYIKNQQYESNVFPLPMCFNPDLLPVIKSAKKYNVGFWCVESDPLRTQVLKLIEDKFDCKENGSVRNQVMKKYKRKGDFYFQELHSCKIGLNVRGVGWDTLRYWELPAVGSFMLTQQPQIEIENDFVHGVDTVFFDNTASNLLDLCTYYLKHESEREKIALSGHQKLMSYHTDKRRAVFVLEKISMLKK